MQDEHYIGLAIVAVLTLIATLKLTLTGQIRVGAEKKTFVVFHPIWLGALAVMVPFVIGRFLKGTLSPLPWTAFAASQAKAGLWAGILAGVSVTTIDLWAFWTTATALLTFTQPMSRGYEPISPAMHKYFHLVNLIAGAFLLYKALHAPSA